MKPNVTARTLLTDLGVGNFNATMIIPFIFMMPATTDPRSPAIMMMVRHIQRALYAMGSRVADSGFLDRTTADNLETLMGAGWLNRTWADVVSTVVAAKRARVKLAPTAPGPEDFGPEPVGMFDFLPDVPGGLLTYAVGAGALYYFLKRKR